MVRSVRIVNLSQPSTQPVLAKFCATFFCRLQGLILKKPLDDLEGLMLVYKRDSIYEVAIHMLGVKTDLAVVWINQAKQVVDVRLARKWRLIYLPARPASYILEMHPNRLNEFKIGDQIRFEDLANTHN